MAMTDPRSTDPRYSDPNRTDPVLFRDEAGGGPWGWIAGISILVLIAFVVIAGWNGENKNTANNTGTSPPSSMAQRTMPPPANPSTTGSGAPQPMTPPNRGTQ
jgi:hypothetical protein